MSERTPRQVLVHEGAVKIVIACLRFGHFWDPRNGAQRAQDMQMWHLCQKGPVASSCATAWRFFDFQPVGSRKDGQTCAKPRVSPCTQNGKNSFFSRLTNLQYFREI